MNSIGILEKAKIEDAKKNSQSFLFIEVMLIEDKFKWLKCYIQDRQLLGCGYLISADCKRKYKIIIKYSYFFSQRFDRIWVAEPLIEFNPKTHMYGDSSLCLYHPNDLPVRTITPLATIIPWISEWLVKYEFWKQYKVWIGREAKH